MILLENTEVLGWEAAIRGMRNPLNSWAKSDSGICKGGDNGIGCEKCANSWNCHHPYDETWQLGKNDHDLMLSLARGGSTHAKYRRMIVVYVDITAPLYWWKEFDTYKVGTVANSCSTMHKIADKEFELSDFSTEHLNKENLEALDDLVVYLNKARWGYKQTKNKDFWWQMIQLLPTSYNQRRTIELNYEVLAGLYPTRRNHKLDEWHIFCRWVEVLPYSDVIIGRPELDYEEDDGK